jgi:hypothetical protein
MGHESNRRQSKNLLPGTIYVMPTHSALRKEFSANAIALQNDGELPSDYGHLLKKGKPTASKFTSW